MTAPKAKPLPKKVENLIRTDDFDWLTGGTTFGVWINRHAKSSGVKPSIRGWCRDVWWSVDSVDVALDAAWPECAVPMSAELSDLDGTSCPEPKRLRWPLLKGLLRVLKTLTFREREIFKLRAGWDGNVYTLAEVGEIFKISNARVDQIYKKAIRKLQHPVRASVLARKAAENGLWVADWRELRERYDAKAKTAP